MKPIPVATRAARVGVPFEMSSCRQPSQAQGHEISSSTSETHRLSAYDADASDATLYGVQATLLRADFQNSVRRSPRMKHLKAGHVAQPVYVYVG